MGENSIAVSIFSNMQGSPVEEYYVNGIRNALLQIFLNETLQDVEREWNPIKETIQSIKQQIANYPVSTLKIPLRDGRIEKYPYKMALPIDELDAIINSTNVAGQLPLKP